MARFPKPSAARVLVAIACCATALAGCTMCPDPFDYSGPVPNGSAPQNDFRARSNGIAPIGVAPRPWPPVVKQEQNAAPAPVAAEEPAVTVVAATEDVVATEAEEPTPEPVPEVEPETKPEVTAEAAPAADAGAIRLE